MVSKQEYLQKKKEFSESQGNLDAQKERKNYLEAAIVEAKNQRTAHITETRRTILTNRDEIIQRLNTTQQELIKAKSKLEGLTLTSPVSGHVQQLSIHTIGGVVSPAQILMVVVPQKKDLEIEAVIDNKDIGFVSPSQDVKVKIQTFNYTKYGTVPGRVRIISKDAVEKEKLGLVYVCRIQLLQTKLKVDNVWVDLSPGMAVTAEIKTGKRRIIEYFLSPLLSQANEGLRER